MRAQHPLPCKPTLRNPIIRENDCEAAAHGTELWAAALALAQVPLSLCREDEYLYIKALRTYKSELILCL